MLFRWMFSDRPVDVLSPKAGGTCIGNSSSSLCIVQFNSIIMPEMTYFRLVHRAIDLYNEGKLEEALDLIEKFGDMVEGNRAQILNFKCCIASRLGRTEMAMNIMREAIVGTEYWYPYEYLLQDNDLKSIRDQKEFTDLAEICREREIIARKEVRAELKLIMPLERSFTQSPWLIALHGNGDSVALTEKNWHSLLLQGYSLAFPQSSQITSHETYTWNDLEKGLMEINSHLNDLEKEHDITGGGWVLSGFSGGARLALYSVLYGDLHPKGLILIAPYLPEIKEWEGMVRNLTRKGLKICVLCGDQDSISFEAGKEVKRILDEIGIPTMLQVVEGLDHDFPDDFAQRLSEMLEFIHN